MNKIKSIKKEFSKLSDAEKTSAKVLFHNYIEFDYEEIERDGRVIPTITEKDSEKSYELFEYAKDKSNIINVSYYLNGVRRR